MERSNATWPPLHPAGEAPVESLKSGVNWERQTRCIDLALAEALGTQDRLLGRRPGDEKCNRLGTPDPMTTKGITLTTVIRFVQRGLVRAPVSRRNLVGVTGPALTVDARQTGLVQRRPWVTPVVPSGKRPSYAVRSLIRGTRHSLLERPVSGCLVGGG